MSNVVHFIDRPDRSSTDHYIDFSGQIHDLFLSYMTCMICMIQLMLPGGSRRICMNQGSVLIRYVLVRKLSGST